MPNHNRSRADINQSAILAHLGTLGPISRVELARILGVTPPLVTQLTRKLIADGLVQELEYLPSRGGRPARKLGLVATAGHAVGVEVASERVTLLEVRINGDIERSVVKPYDSASPMATVDLGILISDFIEGGNTRLLGIGISVPGSIDEQGTGIVDASQLGWNRVALGGTLRRVLKLPVLIDNNINAMCVAEKLFGQGRNLRNFLVVAVGASIEIGIVVNGEVFRGHAGRAGDLGHLPVNEAGPVCQCGNRGCLDTYISEQALIKTARQQELIGTLEEIASLTTKADRGDLEVRAIFREAGHILGRSLAGVVNILDPEIVIILGEGIHAWKHWSLGFEQAFRSSLVSNKRGVPVVVENWQDDSLARSAACLVLAAPFDASGISGVQGELVRSRLRDSSTRPTDS